MLCACALAAPTAAAETREGTLRISHGHHFEREVSTWSYMLETEAGRIRLLPTAPPDALSGDEVTVTGGMQEGYLVGSIESAEVGEPPPRVRTAAVIVANVASNPEGWHTAEQLREAVFTGVESSAAYFREESHGRILLEGQLDPDGDVFGPYTVDVAEGDCAGSAGGEAKQRAVADGMPEGYDHYIYVYGGATGCRYTAVGSLGGGVVLMYGSAASRTITHELGHNLGFHHANSLECSGRYGAAITYAATCTSREYGDPFDVMGNGFRHNINWHLQKAGLLEAKNVQTVSEPGVYTIRSALNPTDEVTSLRILRSEGESSAFSTWYDVEIREEGGLFERIEPSDESAEGVSIRVVDDLSRSTQSRLIHSDPGDSIKRAPFTPGEVFQAGGVTIRPLTVSDGTATVEVDFGAEPVADGQPPAPPRLFSTTGARDVKLRWDPGGDNIGVDRFVVLRDGTELGTATETRFTDEGAPVGPHAYVVHAVDAAGNQSAASAPLVVEVPDEDPPSAPAGLSAEETSGGLRLSWTAATDNVAVDRYRVIVNGKPGFFSSTTETSWLDKEAANAWYTYEVVAKDAAGNTSAPSAPLMVPVGDVVPPSVPGGLDAVASPEGVQLSWQESTDNRAISHYVAMRDGIEVGTSSTPSLLDEDTPPGSYAYSVLAVDTAGHESDPSAAVEVVVPDVEPPSPPTGLEGSLVAPGQVDLSWGAATDNVAVERYVVLRDGIELDRVASQAFSDRGVPPGERAYAVLAVDAAGNESAPSAPFVAVLPGPAPPVEPPAAQIARLAEPSAGPVRRARPSRPKLSLTKRRLANGRLLLLVRAWDDGGIARVGLKIDGKTVKTRRASPLRFLWRPKTASRRIEALAWATDRDGLRSSKRLALRSRAKRQARHDRRSRATALGLWRALLDSGR